MHRHMHTYEGFNLHNVYCFFHLWCDFNLFLVGEKISMVLGDPLFDDPNLNLSLHDQPLWITFLCKEYIQAMRSCKSKIDLSMNSAMIFFSLKYSWPKDKKSPQV